MPYRRTKRALQPRTGRRASPLTIAAAAGLGLMLAVGATGVAAQSTDDVRALRERIAKLEKEMADMRAEVRASGGAKKVAKGDLPPTLAARFEIRLGQMERSIQKLTGKVEDLEHKIVQQAMTHQKFRNDVTFRLQKLEAGAAASPRTPRAEDRAPPRDKPDREPATDKRPDTRAPAVLPPGKPAEQYAFAIKLLQRAEYDKAIAVLEAFVAKYPNGSLTASAYYWMGRAHYVQRTYDKAAVAFADGFRKFQRHPRAAANLWMLGKSLARLNKRPQACAAFAELKRRYPTAGTQVRDDAAAEERKIGCPS
jgi:tol-pal system protein YbgF